VPLTKEISRQAARDLIVDALREGHAVTIRAYGCSMAPAIWPGDLLTVRPVGEESPAIGQVALTLSGGVLRAHRVVAQREQNGATEFVTKGDALDTRDAVVGRSQILGAVVARNGRPFVSQPTSIESVFRWILKPGALLSLAIKLRSVRNRLVHLRVLQESLP
jgi:hypothetical protein